jgi:hypothetical protein
MYIMQRNGPIDAAVYNHIEAQVAKTLMTIQPREYLV